MLDVHSDAEHHRTVLTLGGPLSRVEDAARARGGRGRGPHRPPLPRRRPSPARRRRRGAVRAAPRIPDGRAGLGPTVVEARDRFAAWAGAELGLPCFLYGPERSLPEVRRSAFRSLAPDTGPERPHPTAGATAVGARPVLVAYNVWIAGRPRRPTAGPAAVGARRWPGLAGRRAAGPGVRALGSPWRAGAQVSCNLIDPGAVPARPTLYDTVAAGAEPQGCSVVRAELVGPGAGSGPRRAPRDRWAELDLGEDRTIESRMADRGLPDRTAARELGRRRRSAPAGSAQEALTVARRCMARCRRSRRRSRSDSPPQIPNFSPLARAYSRQSSRTTHPRHTSLASRVDAPRSGKNRSGSTPMQLALVCQLRSWGPYINDTMSIDGSPSHSSTRFRTNRIARM